MSIKADHWIRRMAASHNMIEPFSPQQVRIEDGHKIVSYGTSSYGYDVRCADEFKIFTNINSTIVDPKAFDEKSFVDFKGPVCMIPPNSFALARTVEFFRIPRSVLTICLGKCVTGDTRVVDADSGAYVPITEMRFGKSTLALNSGGRLQPAKISAFIPQGRKEVFELRTRAGLRIRATANHPFLQATGWVPLSDLVPGDKIGVARDMPIFGKSAISDWQARRLGMMISQGQCATQGGNPSSTSADSATAAAEPCVPQSLFMAPQDSVRLFLQALFSGGGDLYQSEECTCLEFHSKSRRLSEDVHHLLLRFGIFSRIGESTIAGTLACKIQITDQQQMLSFAEKIGFLPGSLKQQRLDAAVLSMICAQPRHKSNIDSLPQAALAVTAMAAGVGGSRSSNLNRPARGDRYASALIDGPMWDVVEHIEPMGEAEVFDISVPGLHNFVANDLIVHNSTYARCGIIVNVTPLEPEWEGHVTLEFSNTTTLPAKIYANEGVAQMLFFESDEICETSYKDRGGKYQGQTGVTLPKA